ncbi:glycine--tRNA ligase subunit beta [Falsiroseomonas oryziterrae]|uniref:glycine--tRNA ligase subunit beta n=1 Tax=Falsiroseomonas oryziterrae TaxID=2911368 RepID=UPI001F0224C6|nr:glycine--tRNA ligase subunit beta [Roseomonas sp. NPKOSM-4]
MPELLLELFSEEIPARMQARGAEDLAKAVAAALAARGLPLTDHRAFFGPRRLSIVGRVPPSSAEEQWEERGPRQGVPAEVLLAFIRGKVAPKFGWNNAEEHGAAVNALLSGQAYLRGGDEPVVRDLRLAWKQSGKAPALIASALVPGDGADRIIAEVLPRVVRALSWPKSMRWNGPFAWVRPLHRILCTLDGEVVPFAIEDLPGMASANLTEGHRIMAPGAFAVRGFADYAAGLRDRKVILDAAERQSLIEDGLARLAAAEGLSVVPDRGLLEEVAGLVEWPVPLLGRIDDAFMDLPPEVMRTTMRVNQRYFALVAADGRAAPRFGVVANIEATDGGATLVAGNERVLRARLSDARFFWDQDRKQALEDFLPKLDQVVFHAKLGTQGQRVARLERLARFLAPLVGADANLAARAARLAKADLASGMVGEFPELQGVMGRYYALHGGEDPRVAEAIGTQYRPLGPGDAVPSEPVAIAVALADKIDTLTGFFAADERPTGSGDPFALRRAALGVIRIIRENGLRLRLADIFAEAFFGYPQAVGVSPEPEFGMAVAQEKLNAGWKPAKDSAHPPMVAAFAAGLVDFLAERLRVQLRTEGARHDVVAAAFTGGEDDLVRLLARADALKGLVESETGKNLLAAYKRAANILRIEEKKDGPHSGPVDAALLTAPEERALAAALDAAEPAFRTALGAEDYTSAMSALAALREAVDAFFDRVTVNDPDAQLRRNRLRLLNRLRTAMDAVADFARIEG